MIQPGLSVSGRRPASMPLHATMLCFITTDVLISPLALRQCLSEAAANSFNRITVDGDMSTNDTVLTLANGLAGNRPLVWVGPRDEKKARQGGGRKQSAALLQFQAALNYVCLELARLFVGVGEGVWGLVTLGLGGGGIPAWAAAPAAAWRNGPLSKRS